MRKKAANSAPTPSKIQTDQQAGNRIKVVPHAQNALPNTRPSKNKPRPPKEKRRVEPKSEMKYSLFFR